MFTVHNGSHQYILFIKSPPKESLWFRHRDVTVKMRSETAETLKFIMQGGKETTIKTGKTWEAVFITKNKAKH